MRGVHTMASGELVFAVLCASHLVSTVSVGRIVAASRHHNIDLYHIDFPTSSQKTCIILSVFTNVVS